jgi:hypothetical protein
MQQQIKKGYQKMGKKHQGKWFKEILQLARNSYRR